MEQDASCAGYAEAAALLERHNPTCYAAVMSGKTGVDYFEGLDEERMRYVTPSRLYPSRLGEVEDHPSYTLPHLPSGTCPSTAGWAARSSTGCEAR